MNGQIPTISIAQMKEVDRLMVEEFGVLITMMMEHAGRGIASHARTLLNGSVKGKEIVILAGKGNNGGDGLAATRHLINWGARTTTILADTKLNKNAKAQHDILIATETTIIKAENAELTNIQHKLNSADLIIDSLIGYNLKGDPVDTYATLIIFANQSNTPILAVDIPSGLNGDTGEVHDPTIKATSTLTLALAKTGLMKPESKEYVGELYLSDLSVPQKVYERLGIEVPALFEKEEIIKLYDIS